MSNLPHSSLSRDLQDNASKPLLLHSLHEAKSSVLSLAADKDHIFSGSQSQDISVWDKKTFTIKKTLQGHTGSVLALVIAEEKQWLFSSSGDSTIRIWSTVTLASLYVLDPYLETGAGDLFSLAWSPTIQTLFIGCQNTSLQWFTFGGPINGSLSTTSLEATGLSASTTVVDLSTSPGSGASTPTTAAFRKVHKFFDSYPQYERKPADLSAKNGLARVPSIESDSSAQPKLGYLSVPQTNVIDSAHYGYIYCMVILDKGDGRVQLATGSGDEAVKLWDCSKAAPELAHEFSCSHGAIYTLVIRGDVLYAGCQDGYVKVLDLETKTFIRTIIVDEAVDVLSMSLIGSDLYTCSADGWIKRWSPSFDCTASWKGHDGIVLSSAVTYRNSSNENDLRLLTGGNDEFIKVWDVPAPKQEDVQTKDLSIDSTNFSTSFDTLLYALSKFVAIPSVSLDPARTEDCRQAAIWLRKCLGQLGAQTSLLPTGEGRNPLVLGTFNGTQGDRPKPRILFYGHYDVIPALAEGWESDPFMLSGRNGYLYGRGVTDDKGPIIVAACAAAELLSRKQLDLDLVFLIEGEEEAGSTGFAAAVKKYKDIIGKIDAILVSNSTWIGEDTPCITYGLRGVVHCALEISSGKPDLHSGIEGGATIEPMFDMIQLLGTLTNYDKKVKIPGFYDHVRPKTAEEEQLYKLLSSVTGQSPSSLSARWSEPSLTVHNIEISAPKNSSVIPGLVKAQLSLRIVPDQDLDTIIAALSTYLEASFEGLNSPNNLEVNVEHRADWWLGNLDDDWFKALESAVHAVWEIAPLRIREGGSIPSVPYLEKEFGCHALHLPMGQSSDRAHLPNERISLVNLHKGKLTIERFLSNVARMHAANSL